jgi:hypothetical protein
VRDFHYRARTDERGVALLIVLMLIFGLLILGESAMLVMDNVAKKSGGFRRGQRAAYCADEGLNLGRAWVLQQLKGVGALPDEVLSGNPAGSPPSPLANSGLLTDSVDVADLSNPNKDLCQIPSGVPLTVAGVVLPNGGLGGLCRTDSAGNPLYRINLVDDIDDPVAGGIQPFQDRNEVFLIRSECLATDSMLSWDPLLPGPPKTPTTGPGTITEVATIEVNQAGATYCYGPGGSGAGCGGGYPN